MNGRKWCQSQLINVYWSPYSCLVFKEGIAIFNIFSTNIGQSFYFNDMFIVGKKTLNIAGIQWIFTWNPENTDLLTLDKWTINITQRADSSFCSSRCTQCLAHSIKLQFSSPVLHWTSSNSLLFWEISLKYKTIIIITQDSNFIQEQQKAHGPTSLTVSTI